MRLSSLGRAAACLAATFAVVSCSDPGPDPAGPPAAVLVVSGDLQEDSVAHALPAPLVARVTDVRGRAVPDQRVDWVVIAGGGQVLTGSTLNTDARGEARAQWTLGTAADTQRAEARVVDQSTGQVLAVAAFRAVGLVAGPVSGEILAGDGQTGPGRSTLPETLVARVFDQFGNPARNRQLTWRGSSTNALVLPTWTMSDASGFVRAQWRLGNALGPQTATLMNGDRALVTFTATSVPLYTVSVVSGGGQSAPVGTTLPEPIVLSITDHRGQPVTNWEALGIVFQLMPMEDPAAPSNPWPFWGGTTPSSPLPDAAGRVQFVWKLGPYAGTQLLRPRLLFGMHPSMSPPTQISDVRATATAP